MKKLSKITLRKEDVLSDAEMKHILGGDGETTGTCGVTARCNGKKVFIVEGISKSEAERLQPIYKALVAEGKWTCQGTETYFEYRATDVYWCCSSCY